MNHTTQAEKLSEIQTPSVPVFGYELIREILLPDLLGKDAPAILYWAGKGLARKFPLETLEQVIAFFEEAGWGFLTIASEGKDELEFELTSPLISARFKAKAHCSFQLEAGFLAQQIQSQRNTIAEAYEHPRKRSDKVHFTVKWDKKDIVG